MKYRSRTDITGLILEAANGGATKTKIMYKSILIICAVERVSLNVAGKRTIRIRGGAYDI